MCSSDLSIEVINAILARRPEVRIGVRTSAPRWLFDLTVKGKVAFSTLECDTGVVQLDALSLDEADSIRRAASFHSDLVTRAASETRVLRELGVSADAAAVDWLAARLGEDRMVMRRELEKLALYVGPGGRVSEEDAMASLAEGSALDLEAALSAAVEVVVLRGHHLSALYGETGRGAAVTFHASSPPVLQESTGELARRNCGSPFPPTLRSVS